jgi:hypothetical protein
VPVSLTGRIQLGRFVLEVGGPHGTRAVLATEAVGADPAEAAVALSQPPPPEGLAAAEQTIEEAASVTGRVERALELFTAVAQGRIDQGTALREVDALIGVLERLDREGRHADAFRLARALTGLLALLLRWVALVQAIRIALNAARALADTAGEAWARHELGTLSLGAEDAQAANRELEQALRLRKSIGDDAGADVTRQNLRVLEQAFGPQGGRGGDSRWSKPVVAAAVVAGVVLLGAVGVGVAMLMRDDAPTVDTEAPEVSFDETPGDPTEERSATFEFSADEEVQTFECRLDDGQFEDCSSPHNVPGPLALGEHALAVRATDFAGNRGSATSYAWTIERGEGPVVSIVEGPEPLTNQTTAEFEIDPGEAVRLECRVDDDDFESCPTLVSRTVDEGEHTFEARGRDAEGTAGPAAEFRWTVDTTPPTVVIDSVLRTGPNTAEVKFTPSESELTVECVLLAKGETESVEVDRQAPCTTPATFTTLKSDLNYVVRVIATDAAGNVGPPAETETGFWADVD